MTPNDCTQIGSNTVVSRASWTPLYDVRASIGQSNTPSSLALHYRASITQTTGENWPEVALTLSTASPQLSSSMPSLTPWRIGCPRPRPPSPHNYAPSQMMGPMIICTGSPRPRSARSRSRSRSPDYFRRRPRSPTRITIQTEEYSAPVLQVRPRSPSPIRWRGVEKVSSDTLSATFRIPGRSNIPSDDGSHKVVIQILDLQANLEWVCMPRQTQSVFLKVRAIRNRSKRVANSWLKCKVVNISDFTLLPGAASVFLNNKFVSKSRVEVCSLLLLTCSQTRPVSDPLTPILAACNAK